MLKASDKIILGLEHDPPTAHIKSDNIISLILNKGRALSHTFWPLGAEWFEKLTLSLDDWRRQVEKVGNLHELDVGVLGRGHLALEVGKALANGKRNNCRMEGSLCWPYRHPVLIGLHQLLSGN